MGPRAPLSALGVLVAAAAGCAVPVPAAYGPVEVDVVPLDAPITEAQAERVSILRAPPERPYHELARLFGRGRPGLQLAYVEGELRDRAAALGADALLIRESRQKVRPPPAEPLLTGRPAAVVGGVLYEVQGVAIEYRDAPGPR